MRILVHTSGVALSRSRQMGIERKAREMLSRFEERLAEVRVRLRDVNGPRGGVDKEVLVIANVDGDANVQVESQGASGRKAVHRALKRLATVLQRRASKQDAVRRRRPRQWFARISLKDQPHS